MATVIIPTPLRKFTDNESRLSTPAANVAEALQDLTIRFPNLKKHLLDDQGQIRGFLNIFVGDADIRDLALEQTPISADAVLSIVPAIAGGRQ